MHWCTPAVMFCEVNLSQKFLHAKKSCIIPASLSWKWGRLNLMISGQWLLTACEDLWIPCNLHFCHGSDVLPLHGVCEHMERTSGVIRILPFHYHGAFNTVQLHKSVYQHSRSYFHQFKVTLAVSRCQLPCLSCMHEAQNTIRNRAICRNPPLWACQFCFQPVMKGEKPNHFQTVSSAEESWWLTFEQTRRRMYHTTHTKQDNQATSTNYVRLRAQHCFANISWLLLQI